MLSTGATTGTVIAEENLVERTLLSIQEKVRRERERERRERRERDSFHSSVRPVGAVGI